MLAGSFKQGGVGGGGPPPLSILIYTYDTIF